MGATVQAFFRSTAFAFELAGNYFFQADYYLGAMATTLSQKHLFRGTQDFEIIDDAVNVRIKMPFKPEETLTVMLTVLNPEPVINRSRLEFTSRVNNEPLLSLFLAKPNPEEFNAFVALIKQKAQDEYYAFAGLKPGNRASLNDHVFEEPPAFDAPDNERAIRQKKKISVEGIDNAIYMLSEHVGAQRIQPLLSALESLKADPLNEDHMSQLVREFEALGPVQGAVLTYAPYISILLSDDPFGN